ncbi:glycoside hydrolase family 2 protein [Mediterraneibacter agrestimuris]|uniref:glycoside hydrolase family 2 protein n=1 Tax=Mediterraneibacter agrestimuris TaxID=2941333 RepID=UPI00203D2EB1|nr:glycoside hydrolase family 2 protein [Mediterraneibacter agrestimuris]
MRRVEKIMKGWSFTGKSGMREPVELPHTWNGKDGQDGGDDYFRAACTYDCMVKRPEYAADERVYLQFHGVNASATVILNDQVICRRDGGYATFRMDVTDVLQDENRLKVEVDNSVNDRVYPQKADFTFYGGIYRDVELLIVPEGHFDLDYFGGPGMKYTTEVFGKNAKIHVTSYVNEAAERAGAVTKITLLNAEGNQVAQAEGNDTTLEVSDVHLWDGLEDPYLYVLKAELVKDGIVVDEITCNCGVRYFEFSPKDGFHLNGRPYPLHGVSRHQDYRDLGNAISKAEHDRDMELIREVGANTIRLAHYQHDQYFYDLCDKYGMIVWAEIPYISEHLANGNENTILQMTELIIQNYNHPCIVTWGVSNEITISGKKLKKQMLANHHVLNNLCHEMDAERPTTLACFAMCPHWHPVAHITDLVGWNLYLGWYVPFFWLNDLWIRFWHFLYPDRRLCYSEYGAEGMPNLHSAKPKRGDNTEEYQCKYHEYMLECFKRFPYMWATYYWNMFDFAADARNQGGEPGMNHKGMITFDRKLKKDVFYLYKAYWTKDPFIYLAGKRYEYRAETTTEITVYSNLNEVSLYNNGKLVGTKKGEKVFKFQMTMEAENKLEAKSGEWEDSTVIYKTDQPQPEYKMAKGDSSNWM